jgi:uncharacterized protein
MIKKAHFILYVEDQQVSCKFYSKILNLIPSLNVPGMTEFVLPGNAILGLMPAAGIKKLLMNEIELPAKKENIPSAELYLKVDDLDEYVNRAIEAGARVLSSPARRDWGDTAAYFFDPDNYVIAFAEDSEKN